MGRRSGVIEDEESLSALRLEELDQEIARRKLRLKFVPGRVQQKLFKKRIHELQHIRQSIAATAC
jgi:hypothetical protein